ncbi:TetR/AcrR family transcriptional regulator [Actinoplanes sp. CA-015351]|uniref:TetR/AcrR family transcriptional regulator n=1 Tax=Actinoplanes sp. CA-015351 TaxID=3239897 RepID=UPI003D96010E
MPSRREQLLDAAIGVLGNQGSRALTHRAVDAAASMPFGSTANYYKSRDALISAVVERFAERDRIGWETITTFVRPANAAELAAGLIGYVQRALGPERAVTVARYGLFLEATLRPELRDPLAESARELRKWAATWLRQIGSADPDGDCAAVFDYLDGVILHQLAFDGQVGGDWQAAVERAVLRLVA